MRGGGSAWAAAVAEGSSNRLKRTFSVRVPQKHDEHEAVVGAVLRRPPPAQPTSLMALLADGDDDEDNAARRSGGGGDLHDDDGGEDDDGRMVQTCCVCVVRHNCALFMPCGHTFCRLCSRELRVCRGNCPLCVGFVLEILDIC